MEIVQAIIERPHFKRCYSAQYFSDPLACQREELKYLRLVAMMLKALGAEFRMSACDHRVRSVFDYLSTDFRIYREDIEVLVTLVESGNRPTGTVARIIAELWAEHCALERLAEPVEDGLLSILGPRELPTALEHTNSALVFAEFLCLHVDFVERTVLPAVTIRLTDCELADLGRDMAYRRGLGPVG